MLCILLFIQHEANNALRTLTPCALSRFHDHAVHRARCVQQLVYFADLEQNVSFTSAGPIFPVLTRKALLYSFEAKRFVTLRELFLSHGRPPPGTPDLGWGPRCPGIFPLLKAERQQEFSGNNLHLSTMGMWRLYVLANSVAVEDLDLSFDFMGEHALANVEGDADNDDGGSDSGSVEVLC